MTANDLGADYRNAAASVAGVRRWLNRLGGGFTRVAVSGETVRFESGIEGVSEVELGSIDAVGQERGWLGTRFWIDVAGGRTISVGGLGADEVAELIEAIEGNVAVSARRFEAWIGEQTAEVEGWFPQDAYLRYSATEPLRAGLESVASRLSRYSGALVLRKLSPAARNARERLADLCSDDGFERARTSANDRYVSRVSERAAASMQAVSGFAPIAEQAEAVATDEDATLVLAGAGTGKTAVITGKVAHLVDDLGVPAEEILVLAFNRKAANEIRVRLGGRLAGVDVATFHAFGRHIVATSEVAPSLSRFAEDEAQLRLEIDRILVDLVNDPEQGMELRTFVLYNLGQYRAPHDFDSPSDYFEYLHQVELRTLNGELVKSLEELKLANFLAVSGIPYEYEATYPVATATRAHRQYKPDFYLPDHDLYIEHFGVNRQGEPPPQWSDAERSEYRRGIEWKRELHAEYGTRLIETYSWQHREGVWQHTLKARLEHEGVGMSQQTPRQLTQRLQELMTTSQLSRLLVSFLRHVKSGDQQLPELRARAAKSPDPERSAAFLDVFEQIKREYEDTLAGESDFDDLINRAAEHVRAGRWSVPYRYALVDEFQDISRGRMQLLAALRRPGLAYFLVGDDWQSIYRFAGSDVWLLRECQEWLGHVRERSLSQTFRFGRGILQPSSAFVQRNPAQTARSLRPAERTPDYGITVIWATDARAGMAQSLADLDAIGAETEATVMALTRYRRRGQADAAGRRKVEFSTVHAAKGREADYVLVFDLVDVRRGFPSQMEDDPLLDLVAPPDEPFAFAEERRLFYVALTRARHGVYLIADPTHPSRFVTELLEQSGNAIRVIGDAEAIASVEAPQCPRCGGGRMIRSQSGRTLRCTNYPQCDQLAPSCACGNGYLIVNSDGNTRCTEADCNRRPRNCPGCGFGVLLERDGIYGPFWGCSRFTSDPPCGYTQNRSPRS